jgi:solute carrier family 10 (sodium/bile acid cotransporter), member 7
MLRFLARRWFLLALVAALAAGITAPGATAPLVRWIPSDVVVAATTFVMALPLETAALWNAARRPGPAWLAAGLNMGLAPPLGWVASRALPTELATGVVLAATVPCTLATAAVWTRRAGGNDAVAFMVTAITNLACFLIVPAWLWLLVDAAAQAGIQQAKIDYGQIVVGLILLVVVPIVVAQAMRQWRPIGGWAVRHKNELSYVAQCGVLLMVLIGAVKCGEKIQHASHGAVLTAANVAIVIAAVTAVHGVLLTSGFALAKMLRFSRGDSIAVAFSGSQKTLMVGAYLALAVGPLAILPMVAYHAVQLVVDTLIADSLRQDTQRETNAVEIA